MSEFLKDVHKTPHASDLVWALSTQTTNIESSEVWGTNCQLLKLYGHMQEVFQNFWLFNTRIQPVEYIAQDFRRL